MRIRGKLITSCFALSLVWTGMASAGEIILGNLQDLSGPTSVLGNAVTRGVTGAGREIADGAAAASDVTAPSRGV